MWSSKWVIATVMTGENIIYNAFEQLKFRSGYFSSRCSYRDTLRLNLKACNSEFFLVIAACMGIYIIAVRIKNHIGMEWRLLPCAGMILAVSLYPFVWYLFTKNHSCNHAYFTWRELAISVFGILMLGIIRIRQFMDPSSE